MPITPICHFWRVGSCRNGDECIFSHPLSEDGTVPSRSNTTTPTPKPKRPLSPTLNPPSPQPEKRRASSSREPSPVISLRGPVPKHLIPEHSPNLSLESSSRLREASEQEEEERSRGPLKVYATIHTTLSVTPSREIRTIVGISSTIGRANRVVKSIRMEKFAGELESEMEGDGILWIRDGSGLVHNELKIEKWEVDKSITADQLPAAEEEEKEEEEKGKGKEKVEDEEGDDDWEERLEWEAEAELDADGESIDLGFG